MTAPEFEYNFTDKAGNPTIRLQIADGRVILHMSNSIDLEKCEATLNECKSLAEMLKIPYTERRNG